MVEGVLRGLLCWERNDAGKGFLLLVVVHVREGKEEERLWLLGVCRLYVCGWWIGGRSK